MPYVWVSTMKQNIKVKWLDTMTIDEFIAMVKSLPRFKPTKKIPYSENRDDIRYPAFNLVFDECCRNLGRLPSQDEYADAYVVKCDSIIRRHKLNADNLRERAKRNIFSFIQEFAIYVVLNNAGVRGLFSRVWDFKGVDFLIYTKKRRRFGILSYAGTPSAAQKCKVKDKLRRNGIDFECVELVAYADKLSNFNGIALFTSMDQIKESMYPRFYLGEKR